jgi:hypothetical protein
MWMMKNQVLFQSAFQKLADEYWAGDARVEKAV